MNLSYLGLSSVLLAALGSNFLSRLVVDWKQGNQNAVETQVLGNYLTKEPLLESTAREFQRVEACCRLGPSFCHLPEPLLACDN